jgi:hypothetical protein
VKNLLSYNTKKLNALDGNGILNSCNDLHLVLGGDLDGKDLLE